MKRNYRNPFLLSVIIAGYLPRNVLIVEKL